MASHYWAQHTARRATRAGAIFMVTVPAVISRSACLEAGAGPQAESGSKSKREPSRAANSDESSRPCRKAGGQKAGSAEPSCARSSRAGQDSRSRRESEVGGAPTGLQLAARRSRSAVDSTGHRSPGAASGLVVEGGWSLVVIRG